MTSTPTAPDRDATDAELEMLAEANRLILMAPWDNGNSEWTDTAQSWTRRHELREANRERPHRPPVPLSEADPEIEAAWGLIANAWGGDWGSAHDIWTGAAKAWRDRYHAWIDQTLIISEPVDVQVNPVNQIHDDMLRWFEHEHLPAHLAAVSAPFCLLARQLVRDATEQRWHVDETTVALRKLLEAKDAAVRARVAAAEVG